MQKLIRSVEIFCYCISISLFQLPTSAVSQPTSFNEAINFPASSNGGGTSMLDLDDGYLIVGWGAEPTYNENFAIKIYKTDKYGNEIWRKIYGKPGTRYVTGLAGSLILTEDSNFAFAGTVQDLSLIHI